MKALIVVDMQKDFVDGALGSQEAASIVPALVKRLKETDAEWVAYTMDTHGEDYLDTQEGQRLPVRHCIEGTEGWRLDESVEAALPADAHMFQKATFGSVALAKALPASISEVELMGLCTDICVISNALLIKAFRPDIRVRVIADCCAGVTRESHLTALDAMRACQIDSI